MMKNTKVETEKNEKMILSKAGDVLGYEFAGDGEFYRGRGFMQCDHCKKIKLEVKNAGTQCGQCKKTKLGLRCSKCSKRKLSVELGDGCVFKNTVFREGKKIQEDCTGIFVEFPLEDVAVDAKV